MAILANNVLQQIGAPGVRFSGTILYVSLTDGRSDGTARVVKLVNECNTGTAFDISPNKLNSTF